MKLTDGIFETGAYGVPSKSQNPIVLGQIGPYSLGFGNVVSDGAVWHHIVKSQRNGFIEKSY